MAWALEGLTVCLTPLACLGLISRPLAIVFHTLPHEAKLYLATSPSIQVRGTLRSTLALCVLVVSKRGPLGN